MAVIANGTAMLPVSWKVPSPLPQPHSVWLARRSWPRETVGVEIGHEGDIQLVQAVGEWCDVVRRWAVRNAPRRSLQ